MALDLHEFALDGLERTILEQLSSVQSDDDQAAADFAQSVATARSPKIVLQDSDRHCADGSFCHYDESYPGVVLLKPLTRKKERIYHS